MKNIVNILKRPMVTLLLLAMTLGATAQERLYIDEWSFTPGGEMDYFTISLENGAQKDYTAYQFDLVLPAGLELAYYEGEPEIYKSTNNSVYTDRRDDHIVAYQVHPGFVRILCYSATKKTIATSGSLVDIYVTPSPYLKPGDIEVTLRDVSFSRTDATGNTVSEMKLDGLTADATSTLSVKVSANNKYSTAVFPFDVEALPNGLVLYSCERTSGESLVLTRQNSAKAYTPYILYAENGYSGTLSGEVDASKYSETVTAGYLTGTVVPAEISGGNGYYVMQNKGDGPMFYKVTDTSFSIPAGKCWLSLPAELQGSASLRLDGTTGVEEVKGEPTVDASQSGKVKAVYDLQGREVLSPSKGIYIIDGKKSYVK